MYRIYTACERITLYKSQYALVSSCMSLGMKKEEVYVEIEWGYASICLDLKIKQIGFA